MAENVTALISTDDLQKLKKALEWCATLKVVTIENKEGFAHYFTMAQEAARTFDAFEEKRKEIGLEHRKIVEDINDRFGVATKALKNVKEVIAVALEKKFSEWETKRHAEQAMLIAETEEKRRKLLDTMNKEAEKEGRYRAEGRIKLADEAAARAERCEAEANALVPQLVEKVECPKGLSFREKIVADVTDKKAAVDFCYQDGNLRARLTIDIDGLPEEMERRSMQIPGIRIRRIYGAVIRK